MTEVVQQTAAVAKKPSVWAIILLALLRGGFGLYQSFQDIAFYNENSSLLPSWLGLASYAVIVLALVMFGAAFFIWRYKRMGLILGVIGFGGDMVVGILVVVMFVWEGYEVSAVMRSVVFPLVIDGLVIYYLYRYLKNSPEKEYFS